MIEIKNLIKKFDATIALDDINLTIPENKIFGLIGPDGAGKTTFLRILSGIMSATGGEIFIGGNSIKKNVEEVKLLLGYMPQRFSLYGDLTVIENLNFYADIYLISQKERKALIKKLLDFSKLEPFKDRLAEKLSGGMKQKLGLACCLIHTPKILLLDEPTNGVDPISRIEFWKILMELKSQGTTIIISTPYMEEALKCDMVAVINKGRLIATGSYEDIIKKYDGKVIELITTDNKSSFDILSKINLVTDITFFGELLHVSMDKKLTDKAVIEKLKENKIKVLSCKQVLPKMEDVFIYLTRT